MLAGEYIIQVKVCAATTSSGVDLVAGIQLTTNLGTAATQVPLGSVNPTVPCDNTNSLHASQQLTTQQYVAGTQLQYLSGNWGGVLDFICLNWNY